MSDKWSLDNEEPFILDFFKDKSSGFFIDVGANNGWKASNTRALFLKGWRGICVEADPDTFKVLEETYAKDTALVKCVWAAVWNKSGETDFYQHLVYCSGNSTVYPSEGPTMKKVRVPCCTLNEVVGSTTPDFIAIDAEGCDFEIISNYNFVHRPSLIMVECEKRYVEKMDAFFDSVKYSKVFHNDLNLAYSPI